MGISKINNDHKEVHIPDAVEQEAIDWAKEEMRQNGYKEIFEIFLKIGYEKGLRNTREKYRRYAEGEIDNI